MQCSLPHCNLTKLRRGARSAIFNYCTLWFTAIPTVSADPKLAHPQNLHIVYMTHDPKQSKNPQRFVWNVFFTNWLVLSAEQMSKGQPFSLLSYSICAQVRSWLGVEYWPAKVDYQIIYILHYIGLAWNFAHWVMDGAQLWHLGEKRIPGVFGTQ